MKVGDYYEITHDPIGESCTGMIGRVSGWFDFEGKTFYTIIAENYGPYLEGKKVRSWLPGNKRSVVLSDLKKRE